MNGDENQGVTKDNLLYFCEIILGLSDLSKVKSDSRMNGEER